MSIPHFVNGSILAVLTIKSDFNDAFSLYVFLSNVLYNSVFDFSASEIDGVSNKVTNRNWPIILRRFTIGQLCE